MPEPSRFATTPRRPDATVRVVALAGHQGGAISRAQLLASGLSEGSMARWIGAGRLHRHHPGVYALGHPNLPLQGRLHAALLYAGGGAALSHTTAAWHWQLLDSPPSHIHVSAPGRSRSLRNVTAHHPRVLESVRHGEFPVTTPGRTLLDLAGQVPMPRLRRALASAEYRRLLRLDDVAAELGRGHPGAAALRRALERHRPQLAHTASELELELVALCERHAIPLPRINVFVAGYEVDALWARERVVVEVDGVAAHDTPGGLRRDRERDLAMRAAGFVVLRYTWEQVTVKGGIVVDDLREMLARRRVALK